MGNLEIILSMFVFFLLLIGGIFLSEKLSPSAKEIIGKIIFMVVIIGSIAILAKGIEEERHESYKQGQKDAQVQQAKK